MSDAGDLIDITQPVHPAIPVWPGDTPFEIEETWTIDEHCPVRVSKLTLSTHTGTHADAHSHYDSSADDVAGRSLLPYLGPCLVIPASGEGAAVEVEEVWAAIEAYDSVPERVLLRTFRRFPLESWPESFRAISSSLIDKLGAAGCRLIGTDAPSIDPQDSKTLDAHHAVHGHDMAILEGLVLDHVAPGRYELIALPLRIQGADASPVRAVLRPLSA